MANGGLADDARLRAHLETLSELTDAGARVALLAHQGRPGGDEFRSLEPHADRLGTLLDAPVSFVDSTFCADARAHIEALDDIGFHVDPKAKTAELSGGQQQAIAVARALISDPEIVLLDEPTAEVSVENSEQILQLIGRLQDQGRTVLFISHNLEEVFDVADRIAVLRDGQLVDILDNDGTYGREHVVSLMTGAIVGSNGQDSGEGVGDAVAENATETE
jgi:simple sugar transport system ATP-binding protein